MVEDSPLQIGAIFKVVVFTDSLPYTFTTYFEINT